MVTQAASLPARTPEDRKAANARFIAEYAAAWASATPDERELAALEMKTRLSTSEMARMRELRWKARNAA